MSTIVIASLEAGEGRTTAGAGIGASLAGRGRSVRLLRVRSAESADPPAEDDARSLAGVPGCAAARNALSEQEALGDVAGAGDAVCIVEAPAGDPAALAARLSARVALVTSRCDEQRLSDLAAQAWSLGEALAGVVVTRHPERASAAAREALATGGLTCLGIVPEDRLLAGPSVRELAEALRASRLVQDSDEDEAVEFVMLGPISADPGQPYFLQHGSKAVLNRFDKMDLHLAALATEPACLILTGGQRPSPYLLDRVAGGDSGVTVLLAPESTVRAMEVVDELYTRTRFAGGRKIARAGELYRERLDVERLLAALS